MSVLAGIWITASLQAQSVESAIYKGNEYYRQSQFDLAEKQYRAALQQDPKHTTARYNLAGALYRQRKYQDAARLLNELTASDAEPGLKAAAHYNTGVIHTKEKNLEASIEAYKSALRLRPDDQQARENLQKALLELKKSQQEQKQQQKKPQSSMDQKEAEQKLKLLQEKEKRLQQRMQKNSQKGSAQPKDW